MIVATDPISSGSETGSNHSGEGTKKKIRKNKSKGFLSSIIVGLKNKENFHLSEYDMFDIESVARECTKLNEILLKTNVKSSQAGGIIGPILRIMHGSADSKIENLFDTVLTKLSHAEESLRLWLEAIVMKKWSVRHSALSFLNVLDSSIALHEYRVDSLDETSSECKILLARICEYQDYLNSMRSFNEVILKEQAKQLSKKPVVEVDNVVNEPYYPPSEREEIFIGYKEGAGKPLPLSTLQQLQQSENWQDKEAEVAESSTFTNMFTSDEVFIAIDRKKSLADQLFESLTKLLKDINMTQKEEMNNLRKANRTRSSLKELCGFDNVLRQEMNEDEEVAVIRERISQITTLNQVPASNSKKLIFKDTVDDTSGSGIDVHREGIHDVMSSQRSNKRSFRHITRCIRHLQMLRDQEHNAKNDLVRVLELKNEILDKHENWMSSGSNSSEHKTQKEEPKGAYAIVRGGNSAPAPYLPSSNSNDTLSRDAIRLCRSQAVDKAIPDKIWNVQSPLFCDDDEKQLFEGLINIISRKDSNSDDEIFLKELKVSDFSNLVPCLHAHTFKIDRTADKYKGGSPGATTPMEIEMPTGNSSFDESTKVLSSCSLSTMDNHFAGVVWHEIAEKMMTGIGLIWKLPGSTFYFYDEQRYFSVDENGLIGIFVKVTAYSHILSAMNLRDRLVVEIGVKLPILVYSNIEGKFLPLTYTNQVALLREYSLDCSPEACVCSEPCRYPQPFDAASLLDLSIYANSLSKDELLHVHSLWPCQSNILHDCFSLEQEFSQQPVEVFAKKLYELLIETVASNNVFGAKSLIELSVKYIVKCNVLWTIGDTKTRQRNPIIPSQCTALSPLEDLVEYITTMMSRYEDGRGKIVRQSQLLVPLGAYRVLCTMASKQLSDRMEESRHALSRWIDLSSSIAFRTFGVYFKNDDGESKEEHDSRPVTPPPTLVSLISKGEKKPIVIEMKSDQSSNNDGSESSFNSSTLTKSTSHILGEKKQTLKQILQMRIPLLGSSTVAIRSELYHDILLMQIISVEEKLKFEAKEKTRMNEKSVNKSNLSRVEHISLLNGLCDLILKLKNPIAPRQVVPKNPAGTNNNVNGSFKVNTMSATALLARQEFRHHLLQYILGLDDRFSIDCTIEIAKFVEECIRRSGADCFVQNEDQTVGFDTMLFNALNSHLHFVGRPSTILSSSLFQIISRKIPKGYTTGDIEVSYSMIHDGASVRTMINKCNERKYRACLIVIQDSTGHVFGGFCNEPLHFSNTYYGSGECFVFKAVPSMKIYNWSRRNEYFMYTYYDRMEMGGGERDADGGGSAFRLDDDLCRGSSCLSATFCNEILTITGQFLCTNLEVWTF